MPRQLKTLTCAACRLPIHREAAAALALAQCRCPGYRTIEQEALTPGSGPTLAQKVGVGLLLLSALAERRAEDEDVVRPAQLDRALARCRPDVTPDQAYADRVLALSQRRGSKRT